MLSLLDEFHDEVDAIGLLEDELHGYYEGVVHLEQDDFLHFQILNGFVRKHGVFPDAFHCVKLMVFRVFHEVHFPECSLSQDFSAYKVFELSIVLLL